MKGRSHSLLLAVTVVLAASCAGDRGVDEAEESSIPDDGMEVSAPEPLADPVPVLVPGLDEETSWFGLVQDLRFDTLTGNLLALDAQGGRVVEFSSSGNLVTSYGGTKGQGPDEVSRLVDFAFNDSTLVLLDAGNTKTLIYSRTGEFRRSQPVGSGYRSVALHGNRLLYVPGTAGVADARAVSAPDGDQPRSLGSSSDLPIRCEGEEECASLRRVCTGCEVLSVNDSVFAIANLEQSMIATFTSDGERTKLVDLLRDDPVLREWQEQDRAFIEQANAESGGRTVTLKTYFFGFEPLGGWGIASAVAPSGPMFRERGYEYWIIDLRTWARHRFTYPEKDLGLKVAGFDPLYALNREDGGIYRLAMPDAPWMASATRSP